MSEGMVVLAVLAGCIAFVGALAVGLHVCLNLQGERKWFLPLRVPDSYYVALDAMQLDPDGWTLEYDTLVHKATGIRVKDGSGFRWPTVQDASISRWRYMQIIKHWNKHQARKLRARLNAHLLKEVQ